MKYPAGVFVRENNKTGKVDYKLLGSLVGCDPYVQKDAGEETGELGKLYNFLRDLEAKLVDTAVANSSKWFGKSRTEAGVRDSLTPILSPSAEKGPDGVRIPNGKYPPSFSMKIPIYDGEVKMDAVDSKGAPVYLTTENITEVFQKHVEANLVISPSVYVVNASFGISWRVEHAQIFPSNRQTARSVFLNDEEEYVDDSQSATGETTQDVPPTPEAEPEKPQVPAGRRRKAVA
jgi:hypothetical protein